jgi:hypothetical protein
MTREKIKKTAACPLPASSEKPRRFRLPDFAARRKRIFGDKVLPGNIVAEERESCER